ncbi:MAG: hypothetical protein MUF36_09605, partial [Bacteroidales bacterium]|nr:hypothetical protein [Bacteroidales bacterium]
LHDCTIARLHDCTIARLHDCTIARLHDCTIARFISINTYFTGDSYVGWIAFFTFDYTKTNCHAEPDNPHRVLHHLPGISDMADNKI